MRAILTFLTLVPLSAALAGQSHRPAETRSVPIDLLCAPLASLAEPSQTIRVAGGLEPVRSLFAPGESIVINAGSEQGIRAGQSFYVRRVIGDRFAMQTAEKAPRSVHTAGWVTVVEVQANAATARVVEACDGVSEGDYLEPLVLPATASPSPDGEPDFARPARVILGAERRQLGAGGGSLMVVDRGSDHGLRPGQRLTLFRLPSNSDASPITIGEAFVALTQAETSLIRIQKSGEAIQVGDLVAIHR